MSDSVGHVYVEVRPDARGWARKLREQIRDQTVQVKAEADTEEANLELDKTARTRTAKIKADTSQLSQGASKLDQFIGQLGLLPALAIAGGAALVPLAAALGGVAAALAAPLAFAGGGATLFAFMGGLAVKDAMARLKAIDTLEKHLSTLTKGTAAYATTQKQLKQAQDALPPSVGAFSKALEGLKSSFAHVSEDILLKPITLGLKLLTQILPLLNPLLKAASGAFTTLLGQLSQGAKSQGFAQFIHSVAHQMGPDILAFAHIIGNLTKGVSGLLLVFGRRLSTGLLNGLVSLSGAFANFGANAGHSKVLREFIDYFHRVGPQVGSTLLTIGRAIGHIALALAPLGPVVLHVISGIASAFNSIPIPVLTGIAAAAASLVVFQKTGGFKLAGLLTKGFGGATGGGGLKGGLTGLLSGSVQKVYVVNLPPGGGLPTGPGGPGTVTTVENDLKKGAPLFGAGLSRFLPILPALGSQVIKAGTPVNLKQDLRQQYANHTMSMKDIYSFYGSAGLSRNQIKATLNIPEMRAASTQLNAIQASAGKASRGLDLMGRSGSHAADIATRALVALRAAIAAIHDKKFAIIAQTQTAIRSLEALQAWRIANKTFTITAQFQQRQRVVGPGGGIGHHAAGGFISGAGSGSSDSIPSWLSNGEYVVNAAATAHNRALLDQLNSGRRSYAPTAAPAHGGWGGGRVPVNIYFDENGRQAFTGHLDANFAANRDADAYHHKAVTGG